MMEVIDKELTGTEFLYDFTEANYKAVKDDLVELNRRLTTAVAFAGVMLKFAGDLPVGPFWGERLRLLTLFLLLLGIGFGALGLMPKPTGNVVPPGVLLDEWRDEPEERTKLFVVVNWRAAIEEMERLRRLRAGFLRWTTVCVLLALLGFAAAISNVVG